MGHTQAPAHGRLCQPCPHLRDDKVGARVDLLLQIPNVFPVVLLHLLRVLHNAVRVRLGVPRHSDPKVVPELLQR